MFEKYVTNRLVDYSANKIIYFLSNQLKPIKQVVHFCGANCSNFEILTDCWEQLPRTLFII